jgi:hypothetical protein
MSFADGPEENWNLFVDSPQRRGKAYQLRLVTQHRPAARRPSTTSTRSSTTRRSLASPSTSRRPFPTNSSSNSSYPTSSWSKLGGRPALQMPASLLRNSDAVTRRRGRSTDLANSKNARSKPIHRGGRRGRQTAEAGRLAPSASTPKTLVPSPNEANRRTTQTSLQKQFASP